MIVQIAGVSQVSLLGVSADLSPLVVASVGLLCGSIAGAIFGFCMGLFVDTALLQTLGVSSLVLLAVGYWRRAPARAARPRARADSARRRRGRHRGGRRSASR